MTLASLASTAPTRSNPLHTSLVLFTALQMLDFLTTLAVFSRGGFEANPVINTLMPYTGGPIMALLLVKAALVLFTWRLSRQRWIVYSGNVLYSLVVLWNGLLYFSTYR